MDNATKRPRLASLAFNASGRQFRARTQSSDALSPHGMWYVQIDDGPERAVFAASIYDVPGPELQARLARAALRLDDPAADVPPVTGAGGRVRNIDLINAIYCLLLDNLSCTRNWGFFMFSPEFDREIELRNRIATIWISALLDSIEGEQRSLQSYRDDAEARGLDVLLRACDDVEAFVDSVKEVLSRYTREEQFFLSNYRDICVHAWLARRHNPVSIYKHFDGTTLVREKLKTAEYDDIIRPFYTQGDFHGIVRELASRFRDLHLRYWHVIVELTHWEKLDAWYHALIAGEYLPLTTLRGPISGPAAMHVEPPRSFEEGGGQ